MPEVDVQPAIACGNGELAAWAADHARHELRSLPRRLAHVSGVARRAAQIGPALGPEDGELLLAAAWLHDIGYAPGLRASGMHQLDGARHLRSLGVCLRLCGLVAHHSEAAYEARERGMTGTLEAEFPRERSAVADALTYCDLTTAPDGRRVGVAWRMADAFGRHGQTSVAGRARLKAARALGDAARRTEGLLAGAAVRPQ